MLEKNFNDVVDDKDVYIKEDEEKEADNISINSIVSDQPEFDSDTEIPRDLTGQEDKIILNHVVKRIIVPGLGCDKPSKYDFLNIKYKCYFKEDNSLIIDKTELKDYMFKIKLPLGITKAIKCMRKGEQSLVKLEPIVKIPLTGLKTAPKTPVPIPLKNPPKPSFIAPSIGLVNIPETP